MSVIAWGYRRKQPATRICVSRLAYENYYTLDANTIAFPQGMCGADTPSRFRLIPFGETWISSAFADFLPNGIWPYNSLRKNGGGIGNGLSTRIEVHASNIYDGSSDAVTDTSTWARLCYIDLSDFLRCQVLEEHPRGTSSYGNKSNGANKGSALWFNFYADEIAKHPGGWKYYKILIYSTNTETSVSANGKTAIALNSAAGSPFTFVLGGEPATALDLGVS